MLEEVAVALLLGIVAAGDDVDGGAACAEVIERGELTGGERRRDKARAITSVQAAPPSTSSPAATIPSNNAMATSSNTTTATSAPMNISMSLNAHGPAKRRLIMRERSIG